MRADALCSWFGRRQRRFAAHRSSVAGVLGRLLDSPTPICYFSVARSPLRIDDRRRAGEKDLHRRELGNRDLAARALSVLEANWLGHGTRPSRLYPHQWSWDSACIAMGYARWNQGRAELELRSLFGGQWANGFFPTSSSPMETAGTSPGPTSGRPPGRRMRPAGVETSGIVQPPIHATAACACTASPRIERATVFLRELAPKLEAWHEYLYRERTRTDDGLVEIWHPWESGMDNSPLWDEALARLEPTTEQIPDYTRVDVELADPSERPTDGEYDRYVYLVGLFRGLGYRRAASRTRRRSRCSPCSSTRCWSRPIGTWRRSPVCSGRIPTIERGRSGPQAWTPGCGKTRTRSTWTTT